MTSRAAAVLAAAVLAAAPALAQPDPAQVEVKTTKIAGSVSMLAGAGGNIGVSAGDDGVFLVDDDYAPVTPKIKAAVAAISAKPVRFVINTHWHGDHTGGNKAMGEAGALIVAHDNVRRRMTSEQFLAAFNAKIPPADKGALPVVTFNDTVTFNLNGDEIHVFHVAPAHTDGDAIVHFRKANVVHMGDTFFNGMYPFIDASTGGSLAGTIAACDRVLAMAGAETKIIPGHGPLATRDDLKTYRDMLKGVLDAVSPLVTRKKSLEQIQAAKPLAAFDAKWGKGIFSSDEFLGVIYADLAGDRTSNSLE